MWTHERYCDAVVAEVGRMADVVRGAGPDERVPSCPDWNVRDLIEHIGGIHRWAAYMVRNLSPKGARRAEVGVDPPADPTALVAWLADGAEILDTSFRPADPDAPMWSWGKDQHVRFWPRRMLHETAIHRADADLAVGVEPRVDAEVAADGIDELLDNLPSAVHFAPGVAELRGDGDVITLVASDADLGWRITLEPVGFRWERADDTSADVTITADAGDLVLLLYGRRDPDDDRVKITGERPLLDHWLASSSL